jgi:hypothetical protein
MTYGRIERRRVRMLKSLLYFLRSVMSQGLVALLFISSVYGQPVWTLDDFDGLVARYEADDLDSLYNGVSSGKLPDYGESVARWEDTSGNAHNATQATAGFRPIRSTAPITGVRNLLDRTEEFDNAYWGKFRVSVTPNSIIAPDGTLTADKLVENSETGDHDLRREVSVTSGLSYWIHCFFKKGERKFGTISTFGTGLGTRGAVIDLDDGTVQNMGGVYAAFSNIESEDFGNGWWRFSIRTIAPATNTGTISISMTTTATGTPGYAGDGSSGLHPWGAMFEQSTLKSNYQRRVTQYEVYEQGVPNRDYLFFDGSDDFFTLGTALGKPANWTVIAVATPTFSSGRRSIIASADGGGSASSWGGLFTHDTAGSLYSVFGDGINWSFHRTTSTSVIQNGVTKIFSAVYADGNPATNLFQNGSQEAVTQVSGSGTSTGGTAFNMSIGQFGTGGNYWLGNISALYIFDKALTPADRIRFQALVSQKWRVANLDYPQGIAGVPGVQLWTDFTDPSTLYDATSGGSLVAPDGAIARAEDKSGNGFHATQATSGNRPVRKVNVLNGRDVARFTRANSHWLNLGKQLGKPANFTVLMAIKTVNGTIYQHFFGSMNSAGQSVSSWGGIGVRGYDDNRLDSFFGDGTNSTWRNSTDPIVINNQWALFGNRFATGSNAIEIFKNGIVVPNTLKNAGGATTSSGTVFDTAIGRAGEFNGAYLDGDIAQIIVSTSTSEKTLDYLLKSAQYPVDCVIPQEVRTQAQVAAGAPVRPEYERPCVKIHEVNIQQ